MGFGKFVLVTGAALSVISLAGCGGGEEKKSGGTTNQSAQATTPAAGGNGAAGSGGAAKQAPPPASTDTLTGATLAQFPGDAAAGESVFVQCKTCHVTEPGVNRIGPSLHGIVGRPAGQVAGYTYSPANKNSGITWSPEKLFQYLENPQRVVPGTKMAFAGLPDPQKRANLIAWLQTQGGQ